MDSKTCINAVLLCLFNALFMVFGILLNSVVLISLRRSSQLRRKLCYFMIQVLSLSDLVAATITHPNFILSTIMWSMDSSKKEVDTLYKYAGFLFLGFSILALLTLSIERFTALEYPFFHQTAVTKRRLVSFLNFFVTLPVAAAPLLYFEERAFRLTRYVLVSIFIFFLLLIFVYMNYKMFLIGKSKNDNQTTPTTTTLNSTNNEKTKKRKKDIKNISTCCLAVVCFCICCFPKFANCAWRLMSEKPSDDRDVVLFSLWTSTFMAMISTFNCLIFFWKNSILRREGMKLIRPSRSNPNV